jgi:DNA-binding XRE family transcriptional regulator
MTRNSQDERWHALNKNLEKGLRRQALINYYANELPEAQGKAINKQPQAVKTPQVYFISQLIQARRAQNMTQAELAKRIGSPQATIARIETGHNTPSLSMVCKIATALGKRIVLQ